MACSTKSIRNVPTDTNDSKKKRKEKKPTHYPEYKGGQSCGQPREAPTAAEATEATEAYSACARVREAAMLAPDVAGKLATDKRVEGKSPNKTEAAFNREVLGGRGIYEGITFHLPAGNYTPDFVAWDDRGVLHVFEVKGSYRFASESRAVYAYRSTRASLPSDFVRFHWFVREKSGWMEKAK